MSARRLLLVEDDAAVRTTLHKFLVDEGYEVVAVHTAEDGLRLLESDHFDVVLADYVLPNETANWMLKRAQATGRLHNVGVVIYTGHPGPEGVNAFRVVGKPADLDHLLSTLKDAEASARVREALPPAKRVSGDAPRIELVLYISTESAASLRAVRNIQRLLAEFDPRFLEYTVCDLATQLSPTMEEDRVAFTPTLVKRGPLPKEWFLGDLNNLEPLRDVLLAAGLEKAR